MFTIWKSANNDVCFWYFWIHLTTVQYLYTYKTKLFFLLFPPPLLVFLYISIIFIYLNKATTHQCKCQFFGGGKTNIKPVARIKSKEKSNVDQENNKFISTRYKYIL